MVARSKASLGVTPPGSVAPIQTCTVLPSFHVMTQKDTLNELIRTLSRAVGETCDRYASRDSTDMRPVWLAVLPNQPLTIAQWQPDEPLSVFIQTVAIFYSWAESTTDNVWDITLDLQGEINMTLSIKVRLSGLATCRVRSRSTSVEGCPGMP